MKKTTKRRLFAIFGFVALIAVALTNTGRLQQFWVLFTHMRWYLLSLVVLVQLISYYANARFYQTFFAIFDYDISLSDLYKAALVINFVNQVFPTGGLSGASYLSRRLQGKVPAGKTSLAQLMRYAFTFVSYLLVLTLGFVLLFLSGNLAQIASRLTMLVLMIIIVICVGVAVLIADRERVERVVLKMLHGFGRLTKRWRKKPLITDTQVRHFLDDFYHGYDLLRADKGHWKKPLAYSLLGNFAELLTIGVVFIALGSFVNFGIIVAAYTLANIASLASPITGGAGVYEVTMVAGFVALGLSSPLAVSAVLVYRVFNLVFFLPIGFYFYRQSLASHD